MTMVTRENCSLGYSIEMLVMDAFLSNSATGDCYENSFAMMADASVPFLVGGAESDRRLKYKQPSSAPTQTTPNSSTSLLISVCGDGVRRADFPRARVGSNLIMVKLGWCLRNPRCQRITLGLDGGNVREQAIIFAY